MISKEAFCKIITATKQFNETMEQLAELFDWCGDTFMDHYCNSVVDALIDELEPEVEGPAILQFLYSDDNIYKINGKNYHIKTPEKLYDVLTGNIKEPNVVMEFINQEDVDSFADAMRKD